MVFCWNGLGMAKMDFQRLRDKVAIITGASSGIGRAIAIRLAYEGANVVLFARRRELLEECAKEIIDNGGNTFCFTGDVTLDNDVKECVKSSLERYGKIDVLINNAGAEIFSPLAMTSNEEWIRLVDINLGGVIRFIQNVQKYMAKSPNGGVIINISSVNGIVGVAGSSIYSMTKGGLISLTRSLALELAPRKIRVNAIAAGMVESDMMQRIASRLGSQQIERIRQMHPLGFGTPEDIAAGATFLASDDAKWITGSVLVIDGGYTAV